MSSSQAASAHPVFSSVSNSVAAETASTILLSPSGSKSTRFHLLFTATDRHGHFVKTLEQSDLTILDDHKVPEAVLTFRRETDLPLQVAFWSTSADRSAALSPSNKLPPSIS